MDPEPKLRTLRISTFIHEYILGHMPSATQQTDTLFHSKVLFCLFGLQLEAKYSTQSNYLHVFRGGGVGGEGRDLETKGHKSERQPHYPLLHRANVTLLKMMFLFPPQVCSFHFVAL